MITVSETEFSKNFKRYCEQVQLEPVAVVSCGRVSGYFISSAEYEELTMVKLMMPKAYAVEELFEETIKEIAASRMDARHNHLDRLLDQDDSK